MNDLAEIYINGHLLPASLVEAIRNGSWVATNVDIDTWTSVFGVVGMDPSLYGVSSLARENATWVTEDDVAYLGEAPHDIDPTRSVLVGDAGHDRPIALDFRVPDADPRVLYLNDESPATWVEIAPSIESFMRRLGIA